MLVERPSTKVRTARRPCHPTLRHRGAAGTADWRSTPARSAPGPHCATFLAKNDSATRHWCCTGPPARRSPVPPREVCAPADTAVQQGDAGNEPRPDKRLHRLHSMPGRPPVGSEAPASTYRIRRLCLSIRVVFGQLDQLPQDAVTGRLPRPTWSPRCCAFERELRAGTLAADDDNVTDGRATQAGHVRLPSDHDAFDLVERDRVRRPVVQLRRPGRRMAGRQSVGAARRRRQTRGRRTALDSSPAPRAASATDRSGSPTGRRSETTAPSRPRPRRRPDTRPRRPRPGDGPAHRAACRPSRAAAAIRARPAGSSPAAASPRPRLPARSCTPSRSAAPGREDRPATPRRSHRAATASRPASSTGVAPLVTTCFGPRTPRQELPHGPARTPPASARWRSRPRRTRGLGSNGTESTVEDSI